MLETNIKKGLLYLDAYSREEDWRLPVEGERHAREKGWEKYEARQRGCLEGFFSGQGYVVKNIKKPLTAEHIKELHRFCTENVENVPSHNQPGNFRNNKEKAPFTGLDWEEAPEDIMQRLKCIKEDSSYNYGCKKNGDPGTHESLNRFFSRRYREDEEDPRTPRWAGPAVILGWGLGGSIDASSPLHRFSLAARMEDKNLANIPIDGNFESMISFLQEVTDSDFESLRNYKFYFKPAELTADELNIRINELCKEYSTSIDSARDDEEKIRIIARFIQNLVRLHPFQHANGRVALLTLSWCLAQQGFPPCTFHDPPADLACDPEETTITRIKQAIFNSRTLMFSDQKQLFGFDTNSIAKSKPELLKITEGYRSELKAALASVANCQVTLDKSWTPQKIDPQSEDQVLGNLIIKTCHQIEQYDPPQKKLLESTALLVTFVLDRPGLTTHERVYRLKKIASNMLEKFKLPEKIIKNDLTSALNQLMLDFQNKMPIPTTQSVQSFNDNNRSTFFSNEKTEGTTEQSGFSPTKTFSG